MSDRSLSSSNTKVENGKKMFGLDVYQWHLVIYSVVGSITCFYLVDWIDSHVPLYYNTEYYPTSRFIFALSAISNLITLLLVFRHAKMTKESNASTAPILAVLAISASWFTGYLGFRFTTVHLMIPFFHMIMAGIIGLGTRIHYLSMHYTPNVESVRQMTFEQAKREHKSRVSLFGNLMQAATVILASGGLLIMLSFANNIMVGATIMRWWVMGAAILLSYLAYGTYCIFLLRLLTSIGELNTYMTGLEMNKRHALPKS